MKVARLQRGPRYTLADPGYQSVLYNFSIAASPSSDLEMLHAAAATPARYVMEMARRLAEGPDLGPLVILNPLLDGSPREVGLAAATLLASRRDTNCTVLSDEHGIPIAYQLPQAIAARWSRFLSLLSTVDADLDAKLLEALFGNPAEVISVPIAYRVAAGAGEFYSDAEMRGVYRWTARRALRELVDSGPLGRDDIPFAAIMPFHAGDVLFLGLAFRCGGSHVSAAVVERRYAKILADIAPDVPRIEIDLGTKVAGAGDPWDRALIAALDQSLPHEFFYVYCRPARRYDWLPVHLIDQYAFGLGLPGAVHSAPRGGFVTPGVSTCHDRSVLLHFDAGWPLKIYPKNLQSELLAMLKSSGFRVTVLERCEKAEKSDVRRVMFRDLEQLRHLILEHAVLVGMDSFPAHLAAHTLGTPTICLFASTDPANSNSARTDRYADLEAGLDCRPCGATVRCPRYGGNTCRNFSSPTDIAEAIWAMWERCHGTSVAGAVR